MTFEVIVLRTANEDLQRLHEFDLERAQTYEELEAADDTNAQLKAIIAGKLSKSPTLCRRSAPGSPFRELVVPLRSTGYVVEFYVDGSTVLITAVRHQRESGYH